MSADWVECTFENVILYSKGKKPKKLYKEHIDGSLPYINIKAFEKNIIDEYSDDENVNFCNIGDVLMVWDGARAGFSGKSQSGIVGSTLMKILPVDQLNNDFLYYYLQSLYKFLNTNTKGVGIPHVEPNYIWKRNFLLPPIPEQRAIVKKIEDLFSSLEAGIADLKKAQDQLKIYRQAVLKKAFEGELTKEWRVKHGISFAWKSTTTGEVMNDISSGSTPKANFLFKFDGDIQFIKVYNLNFDGSINLKKEPAFITFDIHNGQNNRAISKAGDVLINIVGPPLGKVSMIPLNDPKEYNINQAIVRFRPNEFITAKFLCFLMQNPIIINWLGNTSKATAGQYNLKVSTCRLIPFSLPSQDEQHQVVKEIESRLSVCDAVEKQIQESLTQSEALRQSILKKAFEGRLLTQAELTACRQQADYEPADVLLARIKAEKIAKNSTIKKVTKKDSKEIVLSTVQEVPKTKISADVHVGLIAKITKEHERNNVETKLSHIKCEKIAHLVEYHLEIPLGRIPVKDAAGPDDYNHLKKVEHRAKFANCFSIQKRKIGYSYKSDKNVDKAIAKFYESLSPEKQEKLDNLIRLFLKFDLEVSEIIATTYAGWNNLILLGNASPSEEEIVFESRENWSERKLKISRDRFFKAIEWLKANSLVPTGNGRLVQFPAK